ncbi:MAG: amino acid ABC transporter permease [Propionibacteriaceae bacterium]
MMSLKSAQISSSKIQAIPVKHYGRWLAAVGIISLVIAIIIAAAQAKIDWSVPGQYVFSGHIILGALNTLWISILAMIVGIVLGAIAAIMRTSDNPVLSWSGHIYVWIFRGTPVLVQLLLWYNLSLVFETVPFTTIPTNDVMTPFVAALLGLGINEGAYMAEIVRAGIGAVDNGQIEAAAALGMSPNLTMSRVTLPQALRVIVPPTGNEFINMLKTSSLAYSIQFVELLQNATRVASRTLMVIEMLITVSIWYLLLTSLFSLVQYGLEKRLNQSEVGMGGVWNTLRTQLTPGRNT